MDLPKRKVSMKAFVYYIPIQLLSINLDVT